jgi:hypothetical protein
MITELLRTTCIVGAAVVFASLLGAFWSAYEQERRFRMWLHKQPLDAQDLWERFNTDFPKERDQQLILVQLRRMYRWSK